jgi:hypothetical protein
MVGQCGPVVSPFLSQGSTKFEYITFVVILHKNLYHLFLILFDLNSPIDAMQSLQELAPLQTWQIAISDTKLAYLARSL